MVNIICIDYLSSMLRISSLDTIYFQILDIFKRSFSMNPPIFQFAGFSICLNPLMFVDLSV